MSDEVENQDQYDVNVPMTAQSPLPVDVDGAIQWWDDYQRLTKELIDKSDYDPDGNKKKSAWRKYGTAFQITIEKVSKEILRDDKGRVITAEWEVEAIAPNGRRIPGYGACSIHDKSHEEDKRNNKGQVTCEGPCDGRKHFTHPEHDIPSTAFTRAMNRAISDMIGAGEVSAEEIGSNGNSKPKTRTQTIKTRQRPGTGLKQKMQDKKPDDTPPAGINPETVQDAEVTPKPEDMTNGDRVNLTELKGINKELDKWIEMYKDSGPTTIKQVCDACQDFLSDQKMKPTEFREVKKKMGMKVK